MKKTNRIANRVLLIANVLVIIVFAVSSVLALRSNNSTMIELYQKVADADKAGEGVTGALAKLQTHVSRHMNSTPPKLGDNPSVQLKYTYEKALTAEQARVSSERQRITNEATAYCEQTVRNVVLSVRAQCVADYTAARPVAEKPILADLYRYDFVSPKWTPDIAGWSLAGLGVSVAVLLIQVLIGLIKAIK